MLDYAALAALSAVIRTGSFDRAAAELGVTPSAVSQRVKGLEERLGAVLVIRGQPCTATEVGARLSRHAAEVALLEGALGLPGIAPGAGPPLVHIAVNADSLATWLLAGLSQVEGMLFDLLVDDQEHSADWLRRGDVSAAVTSRAQAVQGCDVLRLGRLRYRATCAPGFLARWFSHGVTAAALAEAPALTFNAKDRLQEDWAARTCGAAVALRSHLIPSSGAFVEAALRGIGWGLNPEPLVARHLAEGSLVALPGPPLDVPLYWQNARLVAGALAPLTAAVRKAAAAVLLP